MNKFKITLLAATVAGGFALAGAATAAPTATSPIAAPDNLEQAQAKSKQTVRRKVRRHARYRHYGPAYGYYGGPYAYPYGYGGYPYGYGPGVFLGVPGFGFGFGW